MALFFHCDDVDRMIPIKEAVEITENALRDMIPPNGVCAPREWLNLHRNLGEGDFVKTRWTLIVVALVSSMALVPSYRASYAQAEPFYKGKQIRILTGATAGGFYDRWARLLARVMPRYIPGNPNSIVQNMPGGGSLVAMNYVAGVAKPDGLTAVMPNSNVYLEQL